MPCLKAEVDSRLRGNDGVLELCYSERAGLAPISLGTGFCLRRPATVGNDVCAVDV